MNYIMSFFITFIYRMNDDAKIYYGKYISDYFSDDHEGLDKEIETLLFDSIIQYRKQQNLPEIKINLYIGVLSFSTNNHIPLFSSDNEKLFFDFYYEKYSFNNSKTFINGKQIEG